jgi:hypothetical protein
MLGKCISELDARAVTEALTRAGSLSTSLESSKFAPRICFPEALRLQRREGRHEHSRPDAHGMLMGRNNKDASNAAQRQRLSVVSPVLELSNAPTAFEKHWSSISATIAPSRAATRAFPHANRHRLRTNIRDVLHRPFCLVVGRT